MKRELVDTLKERGVSERAACLSVGLSRSTYQLDIPVREPEECGRYG